jgi:uncharacterized surface protein with fasciclin (FAS1) repeats
MKIFKNLFKTILILALSFTAFTSCDDDDEYSSAPVPETNTIVDFVSSNADYSILLEALLLADGDLPSVLAGEGPFTVFAPNNAAFTAFLSANNFTSLGDIPTDILTQVLLNHVVSGNAVSSSLTTGYEVSSLSTATPTGNNMSLYINTDDGVVINGIATVTTADVSVDNGTIHAVDTVIGLPTVVTFAVADPNFSILATALRNTFHCQRNGTCSVYSICADKLSFCCFISTTRCSLFRRY